MDTRQGMPRLGRELELSPAMGCGAELEAGVNDGCAQGVPKTPCLCFPSCTYTPIMGMGARQDFSMKIT